MLAIRLRRTGTTKKPYYRVVVADSRAWRGGKFVEIQGSAENGEGFDRSQLDVMLDLAVKGCRELMALQNRQ